LENQVTVNNPDFVKEWLLKLDRELFSIVSTAISEKVLEYKLPSRKFVCYNKDCNHEHEFLIEFNPADFLSKGD
jgi:hypothetical protein